MTTTADLDYEAIIRRLHHAGRCAPGCVVCGEKKWAPPTEPAGERLYVADDSAKCGWCGLLILAHGSKPYHVDGVPVGSDVCAAMLYRHPGKTGCAFCCGPHHFTACDRADNRADPELPGSGTRPIPWRPRSATSQPVAQEA